MISGRVRALLTVSLGSGRVRRSRVQAGFGASVLSPCRPLIPEPLPMHMGIKGRQVHPLIRFYTEEPRTSPWQPAMVQDCGMGT